MIFGFAPHRFDHFSHLELLLNWWMPLAFLALREALATGRSRAYGALAAWLSLQVLSCIYHGMFLAVSLGAAAVAAIVTGQATSLRKHVPGVAWLAAAAAVVFPVLAPVSAISSSWRRPLEEIALYTRGLRTSLPPLLKRLVRWSDEPYGRPNGSCCPGSLPPRLQASGCFHAADWPRRLGGYALDRDGAVTRAQRADLSGAVRARRRFHGLRVPHGLQFCSCCRSQRSRAWR